MDFGRSTSQRFPEPKSDTPGPGFYGKNHIAPLRFEEWSKGRQIQGTMRKTKTLTFPEYLIAPEWKKAPGQYSFKYTTSIQATLDNKISKKGPYQLFSGRRDDSSLYGYFVVPKSEGASKFYDLPEEMKRLQDSSKKYSGLWRSLQKKMSRDFNGFQSEESSRFQKKPTQRHLLRNATFAYRDPLEPGPADYFKEPTEILPDLVKKPPFMSSSKSRSEEINQAQFNPGATRYSPKRQEYVNGHRNVFLSKVPRLQNKQK